MIVEATPEHARQIADLHYRRISGTLTELGPWMCRLFYDVMVRERHGNYCFADLEAGRVVGFSYGSADAPNMLRTVVRRRPLRAPITLAAALLRRPRLLGRLSRQRREQRDTGFCTAEATYLVLDAGFEGAGRAVRLAGALFHKFYVEGIEYLEVSIDRNNPASLNLAANLGLTPLEDFTELGVPRRRFQIFARNWADRGEGRA